MQCDIYRFESNVRLGEIKDVLMPVISEEYINFETIGGERICKKVKEAWSIRGLYFGVCIYPESESEGVSIVIHTLKGDCRGRAMWMQTPDFLNSPEGLAEGNVRLDGIDELTGNRKALDFLK